MAIVACSEGTPSATPSPSADAGNTGGEKVSFSTASAIIQERCAVCHSSTPTQPGFTSPAGGTSFDTPELIQAKAARIKARAVDSQSMPNQNNITQMTDEERALLGQWIADGASVE